ncbi:MAG TPA: DUF2115 domain-containing protein [Methanoregulaceae archaeon]|nr:DUF2115 domain-containing protein [Methanoregulaceae archaeon]
MDADRIARACADLGSRRTRGELGEAIAALVLTYSPRDLGQMRRNFAITIRDFNPGYREELEETIAGHLQGTYQAVRRMHGLRSFASMRGPLAPGAAAYWRMVAAQCSKGDDGQVRLRFLKFLLSGFCMFVQDLPGHPVGMPFPGGDRVTFVDGVYYCPVREKAGDVDSALCPFCPALQTPEIGYLRPPVQGSEHRKQEFIRNTYEHHHFNG